MEKEIKGINGVLVMSENNITIKRKGVLAFMTHGLKGDKTIPYGSITAVQIKLGGNFTSGYIQFTLKGGMESKGGLFESTKDENAINFSKKQNDVFQEAKDFIENKIHNSKTDHLSGAEELEKLANLKEKGIITQEEFDMKKKKILSL